MSFSSDDDKTIELRSPRQVGTAAAPYLTVVEGPGLGKMLEVTPDGYVLGRDSARDFHLVDGEISRSHCTVRLHGDAVIVEDLGSTNGTYIDGERLTGDRKLKLRARLQIGQHVLRIKLLSPEEVAREVRLSRDLDQARRYVEALIPLPLEAGPLRAHWSFVPSSVLGGDALGYHALGDGRMAFYVIDVCGHGVDSAMHSASVINVLRSQTLPRTDFGDPGAVLAALNSAFPMESHNEMFVTVWYGVLAPETGQLRFASAGHPPGLVRSVDGPLRERLVTANPPIGLMPERSYRSGDAVLEVGERLYLFTDGVFEIVDAAGRDRGLDDFVQSVEGADAGPGEAQRLLAHTRELARGGVLDDDFTLLVVERSGNQAE